MGKVIRVFAGFDQREAIGYHAFCQSVIERASEPVSITPLHLANLQKVYQGGARDGTNAFIYSRFLIPYLCDFEGGEIKEDMTLFSFYCRMMDRRLERIRNTI